MFARYGVGLASADGLVLLDLELRLSPVSLVSLPRRFVRVLLSLSPVAEVPSSVASRLIPSRVVEVLVDSFGVVFSLGEAVELVPSR